MEWLGLVFLLVISVIVFFYVKLVSKRAVAVTVQLARSVRWNSGKLLKQRISCKSKRIGQVSRLPFYDFCLDIVPSGVLPNTGWKRQEVQPFGCQFNDIMMLALEKI